MNAIGFITLILLIYGAVTDDGQPVRKGDKDA